MVLEIQAASIVVAAVALVGTIANASLMIWGNYFSLKQRRHNTLKDVAIKYRDPLLLAAEDLSSKLFNIVQCGYASSTLSTETSFRSGYATIYTSFLFGQFFAWVYILQRNTQFLRPSAHNDALSEASTTLLNRLRDALRTSFDPSLFMILSGEQNAIGELMTQGGHQGESQYCMGYGTFVTRWKADPEFKGWFTAVVDGMARLEKPQSTCGERCLGGTRVSVPPDDRLRHVQHLLVDLIELLDPKGIHSRGFVRCDVPALACDCRVCLQRRNMTGRCVRSPNLKLPFLTSVFDC